MSELESIRIQLSKMERSLGRIEGNQLSVQATVAAHVMSNDKRHGDTEDRLRKVENRQYWFVGIGSGIGVMLGAFLSRFMPHQT